MHKGQLLAYLLIYQVEKGNPRLHLQVFAVIGNSVANERDDLCLHLRIASKDVQCVEEDIALLHVVFL